jgi:hypothetical protein
MLTKSHEIDLSIQALPRLLPQQFERLQFMYNQWKRFVTYALRWPQVTSYTHDFL